MSRIIGPRHPRLLSVYFMALALGCLISAVVGLATARPGMAIIGLPLCAFMLLMSRRVFPSHLPSEDDRLVAAQERFFRRLYSAPVATDHNLATALPRASCCAATRPSSPKL